MEDAASDFIAEGPHYFRKLLLAGNFICAPTVVARRQKLLDLGGFDEKLGFTPDYEMWMKVCMDSRLAFLESASCSLPLARRKRFARLSLRKGSGRSLDGQSPRPTILCRANGA